MNNVMDFGCFVELLGFRTKQVGRLGSDLKLCVAGAIKLLMPSSWAGAWCGSWAGWLALLWLQPACNSAAACLLALP